MIGPHFLEYLALAVAFGGLVAVATEIFVRDPKIFFEGLAGRTSSARALANRAAKLPSPSRTRIA
ncbi:hypothetical protein [Prosthecodimorpha staleyi]|uniref:Uncharacterized protein n=1 Tax=Prosthecodimorpha staleyi TaxID=2840188 RepID=A0A947GDW9_9HYPH|nr:hypothetical protein [Prosthecodimorpha staleyi]MBT9290751.1 hypothetical protein [Prosthecodimorpha staleyi]